MDLDAARQTEREPRRVLGFAFIAASPQSMITLTTRPTIVLVPGTEEEHRHYWEHDELLVWERKANQHHLMVPCTLEGIVSEAMIDSGATGYSFVDKSVPSCPDV